MIWGYAYAEVEAHLRKLGFERRSATELTIYFRRGAEVFTIRAPNVEGMYPETIVVDAFDAAGLEPPPPATDYVD